MTKFLVDVNDNELFEVTDLYEMEKEHVWCLLSHTSVSFWFTIHAKILTKRGSLYIVESADDQTVGQFTELVNQNFAPSLAKIKEFGERII